jgi:hypothetical protein
LASDPHLKTAASPMLRGLLVGDPVGMLFCNHAVEVDRAAAELPVRRRKPNRDLAVILAPARMGSTV